MFSPCHRWRALFSSQSQYQPFFLAFIWSHACCINERSILCSLSVICYSLVCIIIIVWFQKHVCLHAAISSHWLIKCLRMRARFSIDETNRQCSGLIFITSWLNGWWHAVHYWLKRNQESKCNTIWLFSLLFSSLFCVLPHRNYRIIVILKETTRKNRINNTIFGIFENSSPKSTHSDINICTIYSYIKNTSVGRKPCGKQDQMHPSEC